MPNYTVNGENNTKVVRDAPKEGTVVEIEGNNNFVVADSKSTAMRYVFSRNGNQTYIGGKGEDNVSYNSGTLRAHGGSDGRLFSVLESKDTLTYAPNNGHEKNNPPMNLEITFDKEGAMNIKNLTTGVTEVIATNFESLKLSHITEKEVASAAFEVEQIRKEALKAGATKIKFDGNQLEVNGQALAAGMISHMSFKR